MSEPCTLPSHMPK